VPPLWHWLYFLPTYRTEESGHDGHAALGGELPPIPFPRRMWAGGRLTFAAPLRVGDRVRKTTEIKDIRIKSGRTGRLAFVTVRHELFGAEGLAVTEEHDIVYKETDSPAPASSPEAPSGARLSREIHPSPLLLFRYSALTYNGHRIHYDRDFCKSEGYPGLIVHGPLLATLLVDLVLEGRAESRIAAFQFRAVSPLFDTDAFFVHAKDAEGGMEVWAESSNGALAMTGKVQFAG
jgi:3-methylfumaryl-CoA hydratase